jgi:hypothetical protein
MKTFAGVFDMDLFAKFLTAYQKCSTWLQIAIPVWVAVGVVLFFFLLRYASAEDKKAHSDRGSNGPATPLEPQPKKLPHEQLTIVIAKQPIAVNVYVDVGKDDRGQSVMFETTIISQECHWQCSSSSQVRLNDDNVEFLGVLQSPGLQSRFNHLQDVIAIGAASEEGEAENQGRLADARAAQMVHWLRQTVTEVTVSFWTLSIGKHLGVSGSCGLRTDSQRSLVIVGVLDKDPNAVLEQALRRKLQNDSDMPFRIAEYQKFELKRVGAGLPASKNGV